MIALERIPAEESRDLVMKDNPTGTLDNVSHLLNHSKRYRRGVSPEEKPDVTVFLTRNEFGPAGKLLKYLKSLPAGPNSLRVRKTVTSGFSSGDTPLL